MYSPQERQALKDFGRALAAARGEGTSRRRVAHAVGVPNSCYCRWEAGLSGMLAIYLLPVAEALQADPLALLTGTGGPGADLPGWGLVKAELLRLHNKIPKGDVAGIFAGHLAELNDALDALDGPPARTGRASSKRPRPPSPGPYTVQEPAPGALVQDPPAAYRARRRRRRRLRPVGHGRRPHPEAPQQVRLCRSSVSVRVRP